MTKAGMTLIAMTLLVPMSGGANCARDVRDVTPKVQQIKDAKTRERAQNYLQRANRELDENDEFECQSAVDAIGKLMRSAPPADAGK